MDPGFYSSNWLYLGKTHLKLGEKAKAKEWLQKTVAFDGSFAGDEEDKQVSVVHSSDHQQPVCSSATPHSHAIHTGKG